MRKTLLLELSAFDADDPQGSESLSGFVHRSGAAGDHKPVDSGRHWLHTRATIGTSRKADSIRSLWEPCRHQLFCRTALLPTRGRQQTQYVKQLPEHLLPLRSNHRLQTGSVINAPNRRPLVLLRENACLPRQKFLTSRSSACFLLPLRFISCSGCFLASGSRRFARSCGSIQSNRVDRRYQRRPCHRAPGKRINRSC